MNDRVDAVARGAIATLGPASVPAAAAAMLHVLNGDVTATVFAAAGLLGDVLVWRDILVEGLPTAEWTSRRRWPLGRRSWPIDWPSTLSSSAGRAQEEGLAGGCGTTRSRCGSSRISSAR
jgi:hypothetical protein